MNNDYSRVEKELAEGTALDTIRRRQELSAGNTSPPPLLWRFVVIDTIFDPATITDAKVEYWRDDVGVSNVKYAKVLPRNTIIGKRIMDGVSSTSVMPPMFLFPLFPSHISLPCKPGEHVWVMFEDTSTRTMDMGYWVCRITEPNHVDDVNHTHAPRANDPAFFPSARQQFEQNSPPPYEFSNGHSAWSEDERKHVYTSETLPGSVDTYKLIMLGSDAGLVEHLEAVPRFKKRPGDVVLEGSNNTLVSLGRDRTTPSFTYVTDSDRGSIPIDQNVNSASGDGRGEIDIVAGRGQTPTTSGNIVINELGRPEIGKDSTTLVPTEGDPDYINDRSRLLVSQRTSVDAKFNIQTFNIDNFTIEDSPDGDGAVVIKTDKVRIIARSDVELTVSGFTRDENGRMVDSTNADDRAAIVVKANGDIVFKPSKNGYVKLGGDHANKGILCTDQPVEISNGGVAGPPMKTTMGGRVCGATNPTPEGNSPALSIGQGSLSNKVLIV